MTSLLSTSRVSLGRIMVTLCHCVRRHGRSVDNCGSRSTHASAELRFQRIPFIFTDTLGDNPCVFPVLLEITTNKEIVTTFTRRSGVTVQSTPLVP